MQNIEILNLSGDSLSDITLKYILQNHRLKHLAHLTLNDIVMLLFIILSAKALKDLPTDSLSIWQILHYPNHYVS